MKLLYKFDITIFQFKRVKRIWISKDVTWPNFTREEEKHLRQHQKYKVKLIQRDLKLNQGEDSATGRQTLLILQKRSKVRVSAKHLCITASRGQCVQAPQMQRTKKHFYLFPKLYAVSVELLWHKFHYTFPFPSFPLLYFLYTLQL